MKTMQTSFDAVAGLINIYAVPKEDVSGLEPKEKIFSLQNDETENIINIPVELENEFSFEENESLEDGGKVYDVKITGGIQNENEENTDLIKELEEGEWLVVVVDGSGIRSISGTREIPMRFTTNRKKGTMNYVKFEFSAKEMMPSFIFTNSSEFE